MLVDASAMLAVAFKERHLDWVVDQFKRNSGSIKMSTVNVTEVLIRFHNEVPHRFEEFETEFLSAGIEFVPVTFKIAKRAAEIRVKFKINLGDAFLLATAEQEDLPILTLDRDFKKIKHHSVLSPE